MPAPKEGAASEFFMRFEDVNYANFDLFSANLSQVISKDSIVSRMLDAQKAASLIGLDVQHRQFSGGLSHRYNAEAYVLPHDFKLFLQK
ncbi:hypothetical protein ACQKQA_04420 [Pseudomonas sp. NPDC089530]|uniref:hypothetical protein n=1 Tax=Pseudomonas sp. NPDC089530 TaxID=3390651 RepID=UPI003D060C65